MLNHRDPSDVSLAIAAQRGDQRAFAALLERHRPLVLALCRRMLGEAALAEDATQEAVLRAFLSLDRLRQPERFGPWLAGIGLNVCRLWLRERRWYDWSWEALEGGRYVGAPPDAGADPAAMAEAADLARRVRQAVAGLPPGQRAAVVLFYLSGLSYAEAAAELGVEVSAVRRRLHRARQALRQQLQSVWEEERVAIQPTTGLVEMRVTDVRRLPAEAGKPSRYVVILEELGGGRTLPIWVGRFEGEALALSLQRVAPPRPGPYHFAASLVQGVGARLQEVQITRLVGDTFFAGAVVASSAGTAIVDARPSDALNLALLTGSPIRVEVAVLDTSAQPVTQSSEEHQGLAASEATAEIAAEITAGWRPAP